MEGTAVSIEEVRSLVAERQRYDEWLQALEARRNETPARVFERVQADYRSRRDHVTERLGTHVDTLTSLGRDLESRLTTLDAELAELQDSRAEAMLRTAVGEFDSERWEQVRVDVESKIGEQNMARELLVLEHDEVKSLLASARAESAPAAEPVAVPVAEVPAETPQQEELVDVTGLLDEETVVAAEEVVVVAEETTVLLEDESIAQWESALVEQPATDMDVLPVAQPEEPAPSQPAAPATPVMRSAPVDEGFDDLAFLRSVVEPEGANGGARATTNATDQKTLRCTDCGTMNLPTEWYCERCGGELAAF